MRWRGLGPGILLAATSVGASHILMSPEAGARFEYRLLWLLLAVHLLKYPAFAFAPRYVAARGESLLAAYARVPGPRGWALWVGLADMTVQAVGVLAALLGLTASFLVAAVGGPGLAVWALGLAGVLLALLGWGRYASLRAVNLGLMLVLAAGTLAAFLGALPAAWRSGQLGTGALAQLPPSLPPGSLLLVAAILGFLPTSVAVSIWQSLWAVEQGRFRGGPGGGAGSGPEERRRRLREGLADLAAGYWLSALLAVLFLALGAFLLHPSGLVPEGPEVALTLSRLYTGVLGEWARPGVLLLAFAALFSTCYTSMDGFPRTFVALLGALWGERRGGPGADRRRPYWIFLLAVTFGGMALLAAVPDPARVVKVVGALGLLTSPLYYALNLWAVTRLIDEPELRPGTAMVGLAVLGIALMILTAGLLLWTTFGAA